MVSFLPNRATVFRKEIENRKLTSKAKNGC